MKSKETEILVMGTADWSQPIATNQHYVVRELSKQDVWSVTFLESLGLRTPTFSVRDSRRIWNRAFGARATFTGSRATRAIPDGVRIISPLLLPMHSGLVAWVNKRLLNKYLKSWIASQGTKVLWTYSPLTYGLEEFADVVVYHCVDLLAEIPGIPPRLVETNERRLASGGAVAIASSAVVQTHLVTMGFPDCVLWQNVADTEIFQRASALRVNPKLSRAIFAGNLTDNKVDFELLAKLAQSGVEVCVAGPHSEGGGSDRVSFAALLDSGVTYLGLLSLEDLAHEVSQSSVGLIPYKINSYTRGVSPLKTFEYLAGGLPVVATNLPSITPVANHVYKTDSERAFIAQVKALLMDDLGASELRVKLASQNSWLARGAQIKALLEEVTIRQSNTQDRPLSGLDRKKS